MAGWKLHRLGEDRIGLGHVAVSEIILDCPGLDLALEFGVHEQRFQLGTEDEIPIPESRVVQRLHAEAIASEKQRLAIAIPEREGEHAAQPPDAILAPLLPGMNDHLGVALRLEGMAEAGELGDQVTVVVDFSVVYDDDAAILVVQRLLPRRRFDDRQPAMAA